MGTFKPGGKPGTLVQHVSKYQNDGTQYIKPAQYVERAARRARYWQTPVFRAVYNGVFEKGRHDFSDLIMDIGLNASYDINKMVNRIRTGRLKKSHRPYLKGRTDVYRYIDADFYV